MTFTIYSVITILILLLMRFEGVYNAVPAGLGQTPECEFIVGLPILKNISSQLSLPCDLLVCLLDATCEKDCPSILVLSGLVASAVCQKGLVLCPATNAFHIEQCTDTEVLHR